MSAAAPDREQRIKARLADLSLAPAHVLTVAEKALAEDVQYLLDENERLRAEKPAKPAPVVDLMAALEASPAEAEMQRVQADRDRLAQRVEELEQREAKRSSEAVGIIGCIDAAFSHEATDAERHNLYRLVQWAEREFAGGHGRDFGPAAIACSCHNTRGGASAASPSEHAGPHAPRPPGGGAGAASAPDAHRPGHSPDRMATLTPSVEEERRANGHAIPVN